MLTRNCYLIVVGILFVSNINCFIGDDEEEEAATLELEQEPVFEETSVEKVGAYVTQISKKPYAVSLMINSSYICSAVILNAYWLLTVANCFDTHMIKNYVIEGKTDNFTARVGSNYNHKGGILYEITSMLNNFDYRVTALKLKKQLEFGPKVQAVSFPDPDSDPSLGYMATMVAWTPTGHLRAVNAPVIETTICDPYTNLLAGQYVCLGGVQDPNKQFCRRDNGGAVIQNKTLIAITTFSHTCAVYMKIHAFPKITKLLKWLDTIIWDELQKPVKKYVPTTAPPPVKHKRKTTIQPSREESYPVDIDEINKIPSRDQRQFPLPFKPVSLPLQPNANNMVLPRMSLYESYLENKRSRNFLEDEVALRPINNDIDNELRPINNVRQILPTNNGTWPLSNAMFILLLPYPQSAGQMATFKPLWPSKKALKKKAKSTDLSAAQQMAMLIDYDYDDKKNEKMAATTVAVTQKWNMLRSVTNSHNLLKDTNQEGKAHIKPYANPQQTMNPNDVRKMVDYENYD